MRIIDTLRERKIPYSGGMVLFDWAATVVVAYAAANYYYKDITPSFIFTLFLVFILLSILVHVMLDIPTVTNFYLGLSKNPRAI